MNASVLIAGTWRTADASGTFSATNPRTGASLDEVFPISTWKDIDAALNASVDAFHELCGMPASNISHFLRAHADLLEERGEAICATAEQETGLPFAPRLKEIELTRTTGQLRSAADAANNQAWRLPTIDRKLNIRSVLEPLGPVAVFGPNNFPLACNGVSGGDFAAAIAAANPVIAKAHPLHPSTSRQLTECALDAAIATNMPSGSVQLLYGMSNEDGLRLVADRRLGATAFTGSRDAGTALKVASEAVSKPIFLEMSSVNPVVILPGALEERLEEIANELATSGLMAAGQFCTNPGMVIVTKNSHSECFIEALKERYSSAACGTLLGENVRTGLVRSVAALKEAGATVLTGGCKQEREGYAFENTLLRTNGMDFLRSPLAFQTEAFGNATLVVVADDCEQVAAIIKTLEGSLTGSVYSASGGDDDDAYHMIAKHMRPLVGRLLNDKMPTGVAVSPAMNHGGPFPASGHPHFTSIGIPAALRRFTRLACYDNVRPDRLPPILRELT